jgi:mono/diheme cytochrome c family protein
MGPAPPLNDAVFLAIVPDEDLEMTVAAGRPGTLMPGWAPKSGGSSKDKQVEVRNGGSLTADQVAVLADGIKKHWKALAKPEGEIPSYEAPEGKGGDKEAGAAVFATACAGCHGEQGKGGEKAGAVNNAAFLALFSDQALRRIIITGRADLEMPGYGPAARRPADFKPLTNADVGNLVALLAYWRGGPAPGSK